MIKYQTLFFSRRFLQPRFFCLIPTVLQSVCCWSVSAAQYRRWAVEVLVRDERQSSFEGRAGEMSVRTSTATRRCFHPNLNASEGGLLLPPTGIPLDSGGPAQVRAPPPTHQLRLLRFHRLTRTFKSLSIARCSELLGLKTDPQENRLLPEIRMFEV